MSNLDEKFNQAIEKLLSLYTVVIVEGVKLNEDYCPEEECVLRQIRNSMFELIEAKHSLNVLEQKVFEKEGNQ